MQPKATIAPPTCHAVALFDDAQQMADVVAGFLADGLAAGEPAVVITSHSHRAAIVSHLQARGVDADAMLSRNRLALVDEEAALAALMPDGRIDNAAFHEFVESLIASLVRADHKPVRLFSSVADVLVARGQADAAIRIEVLTNQLALLTPVSILCGYAAAHAAATAARFEMLRKLHGRAHMAKATLPAPADSRARRA